jgi:hypothetical protein
MMKNDNETEAQQAPKRDESLVGGYYHGPSNVAGLTDREYWEMRELEDREREDRYYDYY